MLSVDERIRMLEAELLVMSMRVQELETWRRVDEPRIDKLITDGHVADEVRKALSQRSRRDFTFLEKLAAAVVGLVAFAGGIAQIWQTIRA